MKYAFSSLDLRKVNLTVLGNNERAMKCYEKHGFIEIGRYTNEKFVNGSYVDLVMMETFKP